MIIEQPKKSNSASSAYEVPSEMSGSPKLEASFLPLIADTAHDLVNLVSNFKLRLYLARKLPAQASEHLIALENLVIHLDTLVAELHQISLRDPTISPRNLQRLDLNPLVREVVETYLPMAQCNGLRLTFEQTTDTLSILADSQEIRRVVINLVTNALNYTSRGGSISVTTAQEGRSVLLSIRDTGIGISPEAVAHIFERYYRSEEARSKASGTGLGLTIALGIVRKYGGRIDVESALGKGSTFKVLLPAVP